MFRSRSSAAPVAPAPVAVPQAQQVKYNHDGVAPESIVANVPKVHEVLPKSTVPTSPWNGTQYTVEFEIPQHLGKITDCVVQFDIETWCDDASGGSQRLAPTTFWCERVETLYNAQVVENVEKDEIHNETVNYMTDQEFNTLRNLLNVSSTGSFQSAWSTSTTKARRRFYLPLWANFFATAQPFVRGFDAAWRFRLTLAADITHTSTTVNAGASNHIGLTAMKLFITEATLSEGAQASLEAAHRSGIVYRSIIRNKFTKSEPSIPSSSDYNCVLTTFASDSAGLLVYIQPDSTAVSDFMSRSELDFVGVRDSANAELTVALPGAFIEGFIMPQSVPITSILTTNASNNNYLFPFCSSLQTVLESGKVLGGLKLTSQERIVLRPLASLSGRKFNCVSYDYATMAVRGGKPEIKRQA